MKILLSIIGILAISSGAHASTQRATLGRFTGMYAGPQIGLLINKVTLRSQHAGFTEIDEKCDLATNFLTFGVGAKIGYLHEFSTNIALGVEGTFNYHINSPYKLTCPCSDSIRALDTFSFRNPMQGTLRGRIGYGLLDNQLLPYLVAGGTLSSLELSYTNEASDSYTTKPFARLGMLFGAGIAPPLKIFG